MTLKKIFISNQLIGVVNKMNKKQEEQFIDDSFYETIFQKQWTCDDDWFANDFWLQVSLTPLMRIHTPDTNFKN